MMQAFDLGGCHCRYGTTAEGRVVYISGTGLSVNGITVDVRDFSGSLKDVFDDPRILKPATGLVLSGRYPIEIRGGTPALAIAALILILQGVSTSEISVKIPSIDENDLKESIFLINAKHNDFEGFFEGLGFDDDSFKAVSNILGKRELSAGAVLVSPRGRYLVEHMALGHYSLPKGHKEESDADLVDTAKREIKEELGLLADIDADFDQVIRYSPYDGVIKDVHFFIGKAKEDGMVLQKEEVSDAYWLEPADAYRTLSHGSDREILQKAHAYLYKG